MRYPTPLSKQLTAKELITGFRQGGAGNCASIAIIKAALMAFGSLSVFGRVDKDSESFIVQMRDSTEEYAISSDDLHKASVLSNFYGENALLLEHANFLFAAMTKRIQSEGNDGKKDLDFEQATLTLNNGEFWLEGPHWLGLNEYVINGPNHVIPIPVNSPVKKFLLSHEAGIGKSLGHTWFASRGGHDSWGEPTSGSWKMSGAIALDVSSIRKLHDSA